MEFDIKKYTNYLIVSGSHSYGGHTATSDYDLRGWCIPPREYFLSFNKRFEQNDQKYSYEEYPFKLQLSNYVGSNNYRVPEQSEEIDHCIYSIHKFFKLAADCNPNIIENLYVDDKEVLICDKFGEKVRENRDLFLSAKAKHTFTGYAVSQLKRINTHRRWLLNPPKEKPERKNFGLPETTVISGDQRGAAEKLVNAKVREWLLQDAEILSQAELKLFHSRLTAFVAAIWGSSHLVVDLFDEQKLFDVARIAVMGGLGMGKNYIAVLQAEKAYRSALNEWKQYQHWLKTRNPARAALEAKYGHDTKHSMHLIRLLKMGKELLLEGKVIVKRPDIAELLDARDGKWSYEKLIEYLDKEVKELDKIYTEKSYIVPHKPNITKLGALCQEIIEEAHAI